MSNLLKYGYVSNEKHNTRVINSNTIVKEKLLAYEKALKEEQRAKQAEMQKEDGDGFTEGIAAISVPAVTPEELVEKAKLEAADILAQAKEEANQLIEDAKDTAEQLMEEAKQEGFATGEQDGRKEADEYLNEQKKILANQKIQMENEHTEMVKELEPKLVDVIAKVFDHVFQTEYSDDENMLLYLVRSTVESVESSKSFVIKANPEIVPFLEKHMDEIRMQVSSTSTVDMISDSSLERSECMIETSNGMYDCSVTTQVQNLLQKIRSLSMKG